MSLYGFDDTNWTDDQRAALRIIADAAKRSETLTYGELVEAIRRPEYIAVSVGKRLLDDVDRLTYDVAGCAISAIVVNSETRVSGKGLNDIGEDLGIEGARRFGFRDKQQQDVFDYFQAYRDQV